jgi:hypothetical protein
VSRLLTLILLLALIGCDASSTEPTAQPTVEPAAQGAPSELPAADPVPPSVAVFAAEATGACATARAVLDARPLRGDPLTSYATRRDVRAAVRHYSAAARAWSDAAGSLFEFGTPEDPRGQRFIAALDVLAMRSRQVAEALAARDADTAQSMLGAKEQALFEADAAGRELGLGPLSRCGEASPRAAGRRRVLVNGVDFAFRVATPTLGAGATRFVLRNRGEEEHQLYVVPLRQPGTLTAAVAADRRGEPLGLFLADRGAATAVAQPGERATLDMELEPGPYGFVCFVASPDGTPHAYKGMTLEVAVR